MARIRQALLLVLLGGVVMLAGCAGLSAPGLFAPAPEVAPLPRYLEFQGVLVPGELQPLAGETFITNGYGRLVLKGKLMGDSLAGYFVTSMKNDGWHFMARYTCQGSIKLFFRRPDAFASVLITENPLHTKVEIWKVPLES